ncbi:MAG: globin domain-containing protein [Pseudanabaenaceae cyanobacterium]
MSLETILSTLQVSLAQLLNRQDGGEGFAQKLYDYFLRAVPEAKPLFAHTNWEQQRKMLFSTLILTVNNLSRPLLFRTTIIALGERHVRYGAKPEYFPHFRSALHYALQSELGQDYTPQVAEAWDYALNQVTELMQTAACPRDGISGTPR